MTGRRIRTWSLVVAALTVVALAAYLWVFWRPAQPGYTGERPAFRPVALGESRTYQVTLWDVDYPVAGEPYSTRVSAWVKAFEGRHPNIRVAVRLLPPNDADGALKAALQAGRAPDVFAAPIDGSPIASRWTVPLAPYLNPDGGRTLPGRVPAPAGPGVRMLLPGGSTRTPVAFPRWIALWWWVADTRALPDAKQGPTAFDTGEALARVAGTARASSTPAGGSGVGPVLAMDASGERAALEVLSAAGPDGEAWVRAAALLQAARPSAGDGALVRFATGSADLLGGAAPPVLSRIRQRLSWAAPVAVPGSADPIPLAGASGVYVFYQRPYAGVEHTEAAIQVASAYSRWRDDPVADTLGVVPAEPDLAQAAMAVWPETWRRAAEWALVNIDNGHYRAFPPAWPPRAEDAWAGLRSSVGDWAAGKDVNLQESVRSAWAATPASR